MEIVSLVRLLVILLLIALTVILVTRRLAVPYTLGLVVVGLLINISGLLPTFHLTPDLVLFVFLPALLFEGSWAISLQRLRQNWSIIFLLIAPGLLLELVLIAVPLHVFIPISWSEAFLLAAILSPTDPVAVLGLFRQLKVNADLSTIIEGESLFNDGVAGVLYQVFLAFALISVQHQQTSGWQLIGIGLWTLLLNAGGGLLVGAVCGFLISRMVRYVDDHLIETTLTFVSAYGVYLLADFLHASGILAVIITGLILGNYGRSHGMSSHTQEAVDDFWSMIAFLANALLFLLVGAQLNPFTILADGHGNPLLLIALFSIVAVLLARFIMILLLPSTFLITPGRSTQAGSWRFVIFWSGLRGALSLALVLALPIAIPDRQELIFSTYAVILFTLLVQGFSISFILRHMPSLQR
jgi:monovalent cation:H+ antiporter, CPA1 family